MRYRYPNFAGGGQFRLFNGGDNLRLVELIDEVFGMHDSLPASAGAASSAHTAPTGKSSTSSAHTAPSHATAAHPAAE